MGVIQRYPVLQDFMNLTLTKNVEKVVICTSNIEDKIFSKKKLPLTIGKEYNVYIIFSYGSNYSGDNIYLICPDDKYESTWFLRLLKKIFSIKPPYPIHVSSKNFKDVGIDYHRNKKLESLLG